MEDSDITKEDIDFINELSKVELFPSGITNFKQLIKFIGNFVPTNEQDINYSHICEGKFEFEIDTTDKVPRMYPNINKIIVTIIDLLNGRTDEYFISKTIDRRKILIYEKLFSNKMNAKFIYQKLKSEIKKLEEIIKKLKEENLEVFTLRSNLRILESEKASLKSQLEVNNREIKTLRDQHSGNALKRMSKELGEALAENIRLKNVVDDNEQTIRDLREKLNKDISQLEEAPKNKNGEGRFSLLEI